MGTARQKKILGGGPAGLTAAITLARAGYEVEVHEVRKDAGAKKDKSRLRQERHADHVIRNEFLKEYPTNIIQYEQQQDESSTIHPPHLAS